MKAGAKVGLGAAVIVAAVAVLAVLYESSRHRALVSHCRNNLRHLGGLAVKNWEAVDHEKTGRLFWQQIREEQYRSEKGKWSIPPTAPFTCPVLGRIPGDPANPESIDYLGPIRVRPTARETPNDEPIGADRPGNHPSGGLVLRLDTSVDSLPPAIVEEKGDAWERVRRALKD
jgi:hypothetical protein